MVSVDLWIWRILKAYLKLIVLLAVLLAGRPVWAASCQDVFPDGASNSTVDGRIIINTWAQILNSPDGELATRHLEQSLFWPLSCGSWWWCARTNDPANSGVPVQDFTPGATINIPVWQSRTLAPGNYRRVTVRREATLILSSGVYVISDRFEVLELASVEFEAGSTVSIYVGGNVDIEGSINAPDTAQVLIYSAGDITLHSGSQVSAALYAENDVLLASGSQLTGAVTAAGDVTLESSSEIVFDSGVADGGFGTFCSDGSGPTFGGFTVDVGSGVGSTCTGADVRMDVLDGSGQLLTGYAGTVSLSTSTGHGTWQTTSTPGDANGVLSPGAEDSGQASYQFAANGSDQGSVTLRLNNERQETLTVTVSAEGESETSFALSFEDNFIEVVETDALGQDVIAGRPHQFQLRMIKRDSETGSCGPADGYNVSQVKAWYGPTVADPGGVAPVLVNSAGSQSVSLPSSAPGAANFQANFVSGVADIVLQPSDAGNYQLMFRDDATTFADVSISGGSPTLTARPFAFAVTVPGNPAATAPDGAVFRKAGESFGVNLRAVAWQSADDQNVDGVADGHDDADPDNNANLADNNSVAAFHSTPVQLSADLLFPADGHSPGLASSSSPDDGRIVDNFSGGNGSTGGVYYPEVGIMELDAEVVGAQYLSASAAVTARILGRSGAVGRFTPAYLGFDGGDLVSFCDVALDFHYLSQPIDVSLDVSARNALGGVTQNYEGGFARLSESLGTLSAGAVDTTGGDLTDRASPGLVSANWSAGVGEIEVPVTIERAVVPDGPFLQTSVGVNLEDEDGVTWTPVDIDLDVNSDGNNDFLGVGDTILKHGRLVLNDAHGPETAYLPVNMQLENWDGTDWRRNEDDSCTRLVKTAIVYPDGPISNSSNLTVEVGGGFATGEYPVQDALSVGFTDGDAGHRFTPPGAGNTGVFGVDILLGAYPWLQFDWNQDGDHSDATLPTANMQFGVYRGHDRVLYWEEVLD